MTDILGLASIFLIFFIFVVLLLGLIFIVPLQPESDENYDDDATVKEQNSDSEYTQHNQ